MNNMKKMHPLLLVLILLGLSNQASAIPIITLTPQSSTIQSGGNLFVDVNVSGLQSGGFNSLLGAFSMDVLFDSNLLFLPISSSLGNALGDPANSDETIAGVVTSVPGKFSFFEISYLDGSSSSCSFCTGPYLDNLQADSFRLTTLAFYLPYNTLPGGAPIIFSTANVLLADALGDELTTGINPSATVTVSEPQSFLLIMIGLITIVTLRSNKKMVFNLMKGICLLGFAIQVQASNSMIVLGKVGSTDSDNAVFSYSEKGAFDRILVFEPHFNPNHLVIGPDGNLYEDAFSSINRRSPTTGKFIDTYTNVSGNNSSGGIWCFGSDGNLYLLKPQDQSPQAQFVINRIVGPLLPNAKQLDANFEVIFTEFVGIGSNLYKMEFGPDITGDGIKELYVLLEGRVIAYNGNLLMQNNELIEVSRVTEGGGLRNFAIAPNGSLYVWHAFTHTINQYTFNPSTTSFNLKGNFISNIADLRALTFGPDSNNDGIQDLYLGFKTFDPYSPAQPAELYDGQTGVKIKTLISTNGGSIHSISDIIFAPAVDPKKFNVFSLNYGVSFEGDSYIRTDLDIRRNDNYGLQDFVEIGTGRGGDGKSFGAADAMRGFIFGFGNSEFDITNLPNEAISSAVLEMTVKGFPNGNNEIYQIDIHQLVDNGSAPFSFLLEGNGFEGINGPAGSTDPDFAYGVAWAGADINNDPNAINNYSQPKFSPSIIATAIVKQSQAASGTVVRWDITSYVQGLVSHAYNGGIILRDVTSLGTFRELSLYSKDSTIEAYRPRLLIGYGKGNLDGDNDVDKNDIAVITKVLNSQAYGPEDPKDLNKDGFINVLDARILVGLCTRMLCATN